MVMPEEALFLTQSEFVYFLTCVLVFHNQSCTPCFFPFWSTRASPSTEQIIFISLFGNPF